MPKPKVEAFFRTPGTGIPAHTIDNGVHKTVPAWRLQVTPAARVELIDQATNTPIIYAELAWVDGYLNQIIDISVAPSSYTNIKRNSIWKQMYQYNPRPVYYVDGTATAVPRNEYTFPCVYCGICLPEGLITVDHQRPQAGGEAEATAKVFRMFNLTGAGPIGTKGAALQGHNLSYLQSLAQTHPYDRFQLEVVPTKTLRGHASASAASSLNQRYTLNREGCFLYSIIVAAGALSELHDRCMHSFLNLAPACQSCNSSRGNAGLKY